MKTNKNKKLKLGREALASLQDHDLRQAAGGISATCSDVECTARTNTCLGCNG